MGPLLLALSKKDLYQDIAAITVSKKNWLFAFLTAGAVCAALPSLLNLLRDTKTSEYYSHIPLIPVVSAYLIIRRRKEIFRGVASFHAVGILMMAAGAALYLAGRSWRASLGDHAAMITSAALIFWWGTYLVLYGKNRGQRNLFPLAFLVFAVPIPAFLIEKIIGLLVVGSTYLTRLLFEAFGVPFVQKGPIFYLPGFYIEVAKECSGIRSSLALFITTVLASHLFLRKFWKQTLVAVAVFPVALLKNAIRIVTLYLLSYFVDIRIIEGGFLHKSGGFIFFGMGLFVLGFLFWLLREHN
jgi:exosortase